MSYKVTDLYEQTSGIYVFKFSDEVYIALTKIHMNRFSEFEGKRFEVWFTSPSFGERGTKVSVDKFGYDPSKITLDEMFVSSGKKYASKGSNMYSNRRPSEKRLEAIINYLQ